MSDLRLFRTPFGHFLGFSGISNWEEGSRADPVYAAEMISLSWNPFGVPMEELEEVAGEREVWESLLRLLTMQPRISSSVWMDET